MSASPPKRPFRAADFIDQLAIAGRYHFTTEEAAEALGLSEIAARAAIRRLKRRGVVAAPLRGFHVLVSPEHRAAGCPPAAQFVHELMAHVEAPYYIGLLSAAEHYGAAPEPPTAVQVITEKNRPSIRCGRVAVQFVARQSAADVPTREVQTIRGPVLVATPEATAIDIAAYPAHVGGLDQIELVLLGLAPHLDPATLADVASRIAEVPWAQRLGYLLDRVGATRVTDPLAAFVAENAPHVTPLDPRLPWTGTPRDTRWKVALNT